MKTLSLLCLLLAALPIFGQPADPAQVLFDVGTRHEQAGRAEQAKLILLVLASTYHGHPLAERAKVEIGALCLFMEGQAQVKAAKPQEAYDTFRTVMRVYPESPLAKVADETAKSLGIPADPRR
jgi:outer membrane protein assembly factor BamD (BamD/ComL family)